MALPIPGAIIAVCVTFVFGCSFFFGFYFGMIEKDVNHNNEIDDWIERTVNETCTPSSIHLTSQETCRILSQTTTPRDCSRRHSCNCPSTSVPTTSCSTRESNAGNQGYCRVGSQCCVRYTLMSFHLSLTHTHTHIHKQGRMCRGLG
jgi:hypothetical protein